MKQSYRLLVFGASIIFFSCTSEKNNVATKNSNAAPTQVDVYVAKTQPFQATHKASGSLLAYESVNLTTETSGKIKTINFTESSRVTKGTLLLELQNEDLKALSKQADLKQKLLSKELDRKKELLKIDGISQEEFDQAENDYLTAVAQNELNKANVNKTRIFAPFTGMIGLRSVSEGDYIASNTAVASLQQLNKLKLEFDLPEEFANNIKKEAIVKFNVATTDSVFTAKIYAVEPMVNPNTRTIRVRAVVENNTKRLIPGAFADIEVGFEKIPDAILIPSSAVIPELDGQKVWLKKGGKVTAVSIKTSHYTSNNVLVANGINSGDTIITSGLLQIKPGMAVGVKNVETNNAQ